MQLKCHRTVLNIEDPETGLKKAVRLKVKNFTVEEQTAFARDYYKSANPESAAMIARKDTAEEQEQEVLDAGTDKERAGAYKIGQAEITRRRLSEMSDETRKIYDKLDAAEEAFSNGFIVDTIRRYVRIEPGQGLDMADDFESDDAPVKPVVTGLDLANSLGGREDIIRDLIRMVHLENTQTPVAKKVLRPLFGFVPFSVAHEKAADGQKPDQTADAVNEPVSVVTVDAEPITTVPLSGSEATD